MSFIQQNIMQDADDAWLIGEFKTTGKLDFLAALYQRYMNLVYGVCLRYFDEEASKDAVMQIFEELIIKLKQHEVQNFKSWLHVLARNHCLMKLRAMKNKESRQVSIDDHPIVENGENRHHENGVSLEDNLQSMEKCLETLPEEQKRSVDLFYLKEKSYREVSVITGYEMNKVKSYIQNGKRNLKICMEQQND
ncbi:RNA polymerase sigma factor [Chitinophaga ginsengisegetis]|uniref:RNA polymerase sigma factor n=1 Tax=Chitinophaga ginsengisegetis TaxID=393003 RepID=UPI000DBA2B8E|nr:sigma-70 family RNA polymerase sigma factor [Chitinophaga ginsengisegetis]MDR6566406.1 RNA polymerase sigma-70 factor (ECF subfamily) [Chitinophaga ginsengisegetis]MDR6646136.1 RNA polymerase sigma-70 factor (ECF subfamily) [Chitinophaga ginsengisegetis]MDR6651272.1 RNA polymerase sigma-70 factor (ECF subfamily) [Chitinophaga ginsengisegetis]